MKVCYIDETGTDGKSPVIVIAGILVDAIRLGATRDEFQKHLIAAQDTLGKSPREIKGVELYKKRNQWRNIQGTERHKLFEDLCKLVVERKHEIVLSAVDLERARCSPIEGGLSPWVSAGLHVSLQVQRRTQKIKNRKGDSLLVFDQHKELTKLNELIGEPPAWTDGYYGRKGREERFGSIIDVPLFAESHNVGLLQVADVLAFMFRRYSELHDYGLPEEFDGEKVLLTRLVDAVKPRLVDPPHRFPPLPSSHAARWFRETTPASISSL